MSTQRFKKKVKKTHHNVVWPNKTSNTYTNTHPMFFKFPVGNGRTSFGTCKKGPSGFWSSRCTLKMEENHSEPCYSYFIDWKSDGQESRTLVTLHPSTFLHQSYDKSARPVATLRVVVLLVQLQPVLRVGPERACKTQRTTTWLHLHLSTGFFLGIRSKLKISGPTWEIPATASRVASNPATLVDRHRPTVSLIALQCVGRQVTHLQLCEIALEVFKRHPEREWWRWWLVKET